MNYSSIYEPGRTKSHNVWASKSTAFRKTRLQCFLIGQQLIHVVIKNRINLHKSSINQNFLNRGSGCCISIPTNLIGINECK